MTQIELRLAQFTNHQAPDQHLSLFLCPLNKTTPTFGFVLTSKVVLQCVVRV